jgi:hypothetical protein
MSEACNEAALLLQGLNHVRSLVQNSKRDAEIAIFAQSLAELGMHISFLAENVHVMINDKDEDAIMSWLLRSDEGIMNLQHVNKLLSDATAEYHELIKLGMGLACETPVKNNSRFRVFKTSRVVPQANELEIAIRLIAPWEAELEKRKNAIRDGNTDEACDGLLSPHVLERVRVVVREVKLGLHKMLFA